MSAVPDHDHDDDDDAQEQDAPTAPPEVPPDRDVSKVDASQYPWRDLTRIKDLRGDGFQVVMARSALNDMHRHGRGSRDVEVCGVIVGNVYRDERGPYLYVEASIKGDHAAGKTAQVTFTAETWNHINDEMERNWSGRKILGWYHTHPGFGIFLSEMDLFIQNNFFPEPWQVAYVYDPHSGEDGVFVWKQGKATRDAYLADPDTINTDPPKAGAAAAAQGSREPDIPTPGTVAELSERVQALETRAKWTAIGLLLVAALAVVSPLITPLILPPLDRPVPADPGQDMGFEDGHSPAIPASLLPPPQMPLTAPTTEPTTAPATAPTPAP